MKKGRLYFITGGARSGKSRFAEELASLQEERVLYIATCEACDEEMAKRIELHKKRRSPLWKTIEEPLNVDKVLSQYGNEFKVILIDCLTLFVTNHLFVGQNEQELNFNSEKENEVLNKVRKLADISLDINANVIIVSNEVGMGLVPDNSLGRFYRDLLGRANQVIANKAHEVYFMVSGLPLKIKS
ncbi:MAG TPA: bifunctional adenosylcobinamide kinase/adenosylcobinamide-phosphate guanylyltransferase [Thermoanaerobacterales bacterium]|nr:bifunctional adenosylcobinamide kinase/adenosylcobinamide-phosphate guanylyltransferase [Thermoanaerobacterales bacterium]